jgi:hypothetical protein
MVKRRTQNMFSIAIGQSSPDNPRPWVFESCPWTSTAQLRFLIHQSLGDSGRCHCRILRQVGSFQQINMQSITKHENNNRDVCILMQTPQQGYTWVSQYPFYVASWDDCCNRTYIPILYYWSGSVVVNGYASCSPSLSVGPGPIASSLSCCLPVGKSLGTKKVDMSDSLPMGMSALGSWILCQTRATSSVQVLLGGDLILGRWVGKLPRAW